MQGLLQVVQLRGLAASCFASILSSAGQLTLVCRSYTTTVFVSSTSASLRLLLLKSRHLRQQQHMLRQHVG
jgi:hypothetical protein